MRSPKPRHSAGKRNNDDSEKAEQNNDNREWGQVVTHTDFAISARVAMCCVFCLVSEMGEVGGLERRGWLQGVKRHLVILADSR
eukprot:5483056-Pleurochrysis_carterae.AAC.2